MGFCTNAGWGNVNNFHHRESAYYDCQFGSIREGGNRYCGVPKSRDGDVIICEVNLAKGVLRWKKNGDLFRECAVPAQIKGKTLYLSILMYHDGDEVEVSV